MRDGRDEVSTLGRHQQRAQSQHLCYSLVDFGQPPSDGLADPRVPIIDKLLQTEHDDT